MKKIIIKAVKIILKYFDLIFKNILEIFFTILKKIPIDKNTYVLLSIICKNSFTYNGRRHTINPSIINKIIWHI